MLGLQRGDVYIFIDIVRACNLRDASAKHPSTWSPEKMARSSSSTSDKWFSEWPGVNTT